MKRFLPWLAAFGLLIVAFGTIFVAIQQSQRSDANYPQVQIAEDAIRGLNEGELPAVVVGSKVDMAKSLAPFLIIYDKSGKVVLGSGEINGKVPQIPKGVLKASDGKEYHAVTWQPQGDTRIASVTVAGKNYYAVSGRNLREVEKNENQTMQIVLLGALSAGLLIVVLFIFIEIFETF